MATITATVNTLTSPPSVLLVTAGGVGIIERIQGVDATTVRGTTPTFTGTTSDYGCPQETPVTYRFAGATSALVGMPDVGVWLIPAGRPELATQLIVAQYPVWVRPVKTWVAEIPGRANPVVVSSSVRSARSGAMTVRAYDRNDYDVLNACLEVTGPMLLSSPQRHLPLESRLLWVVIDDVTEESIGPYSAMTWLFTLPLTRVDRPAVVAVEAGHRWADEVGKWSAQVGTWSQQ